MEKQFTHLTPEQIIYKYKNYISVRSIKHNANHACYLTPNEREQLFLRLAEHWKNK